MTLHHSIGACGLYIILPTESCSFLTSMYHRSCIEARLCSAKVRIEKGWKRDRKY